MLKNFAIATLKLVAIIANWTDRFPWEEQAVELLDLMALIEGQTWKIINLGND